MAISRSDMIRYFDNFNYGFSNQDSGSLGCFKCGNILYNSSSRKNYQCINSHTFTYDDLVMYHAEFMASLVSHLDNKYICGVQMQN